MHPQQAQTPTQLTSISTDPVADYARSVVEGAILAGPLVRFACKRHLEDLEQQDQRALDWRQDKADRAIGFFRDVLCLNGGEFEGVPFELEPFQKFIVGNLFGWYGADGYRRFRRAYIEIGKGNGKSPLAAGIGLYMLTADQEARAEVYAAAAKKDQALILFRDAVVMVDKSPMLSRQLKKYGGGTPWNLLHQSSGSFFRAISSDDSQSPTLGSIGLR
jgi:phage terminase large subunit-like protein